MIIKFNGIEGNQGSFIICDDLGNPLFHFLTQVEDKVQLEQTIKNYLLQVKAEQDEQAKIKTKVESTIVSLTPFIKGL